MLRLFLWILALHCLQAKAESGFVRSADGEVGIYFLKSGNPTKQPIIFLHGNGLDSESFAASLDDLARDYKVIAYDQRGQGRSIYAGIDYSLDTMVSERPIKILKQHMVVTRFRCKK